MTVGTNYNAIESDSIEDELQVLSQRPRRSKTLFTYLSIFRGQTVEALLNYVVAIQILNQLYNSVSQRINDRLNLVFNQYVSNEYMDAGFSNLFAGRDELYHLL